MTPRFGRGQFSIVEEVGRDPLRPYAEVVDNRTKERLEQMAGLGIQIGQQAVRYDVLLEYTGELVEARRRLGSVLPERPTRLF